MATLRLFLLGSLEIRHDDQQLPTPPTLKSQPLFAYLVLHRQQPQRRERLADIFWGDRPERRARRSLTTALWHICRCLPNEDVLLSDVRSVQVDPTADLWLDDAEFESLATRSEPSCLQSAIILTFGILHFARGVPRHLLVIPTLWALSGLRWLYLGMFEDAGLVIAGVGGVVQITARAHCQPRSHPYAPVAVDVRRKWSGQAEDNPITTVMLVIHSVGRRQGES